MQRAGVDMGGGSAGSSGGKHNRCLCVCSDAMGVGRLCVHPVNQSYAGSAATAASKHLCPTLGSFNRSDKKLLTLLAQDHIYLQSWHA
jgi:hypothetical protein